MLKKSRIALLMVLALAFNLLSFDNAKAQTFRKTLTRSEDFVILSGRQAMDVIGADVEELRLYACYRSKCYPIPTQVDKIDAAGRYVFPNSKIKDPVRDGKLLDPNDEISFMASDAGDMRPPDWRPEKATRGIQIKLSDPLDGAQGWVYLFDEPGSEAPDTTDYVDYYMGQNTTKITSPQFVLGWQSHKINYDTVRMKTASGELGPDVLDRQKVGIQAKLAKRDLTLSVPENIMRALDIAVIDGPVRVIIDQVVMLELANFSMQWGTEYFIKYYRCGQNNSVHFSFPLSSDSLFRTMVFYWSLDFTDDLIGSSYYDKNHQWPLPISSEVRNDIPGDTPHYWWGLTGPQGTLVQALDLDEDITPYFACGGLWQQDSSAPDKKGNHPGRLEIGFACRETGPMPEKKDFHWFNFILFPDDPSPAGIKALKNLVEHPLEISIEKIN